METQTVSFPSVLNSILRTLLFIACNLFLLSINFVGWPKGVNPF